MVTRELVASDSSGSAAIVNLSRDGPDGALVTFVRHSSGGRHGLLHYLQLAVSACRHLARDISTETASYRHGADWYSCRACATILTHPRLLEVQQSRKAYAAQTVVGMT